MAKQNRFNGMHIKRKKKAYKIPQSPGSAGKV